jgi:predicted nucleotidyltransferase component of viral defense system
VKGRIEAEIDHYPCYVYSLEMIVIEKLRALCQQSPNYSKRMHPTTRARDFYDIYSAITEGGVSLSGSRVGELVVEVFRAKDVDLSLLGALGAQREFHRTDWPAVQGAVRKSLREYDYYFDYVVEEVRALEALWIE